MSGGMMEEERRRRVAVDLTPVQPAGLNGGIKPLALSLLAGLATRNWDITCLCRKDALGELRDYFPSAITLLPLQDGEAVAVRYEALVREQGAFDLNYFPMQRVSFTHPESATVSAIMDVQYADHPGNFSEADRAGRADAFQSCVDRSDRIVAISGFTRSRIEALSSFPPDLIDVIHIVPPHLQAHAPGEAQKVLARHGLEPGGYVIYPANFWVHKGHRALLAGYDIYRSHAASRVKLVLTGDAGSPLGAEIAEAARPFGDDVVITGFVAPHEIEILLASSAGLVFPSSYEGFGIPLVEAMMLDVPVAAAWSTCLPEVAGGAALLFDPGSPDAIADAIDKLVSDGALRSLLVERGRQRLNRIGTHETMIAQYEQVFERALSMPRQSDYAPHGVFADGWAGRSLHFQAGEDGQGLDLEVVLSVPNYLPQDGMRLTVMRDGVTGKRVTLWRGGVYRLRERFEHAGELTVVAEDSFRPSELFASDDVRELSVRVHSAMLRAGAAKLDLLGAGTWRRAARTARDAVVVLCRHKAASGTELAATTVPANLSGLLGLSMRHDGRKVIFNPGAREMEDGSGARPPQIVAAELTDSEPEIALDPRRPECALLCLHSRPIGPPTSIEARPVPAAPGFSVVVPSFNQGRFIGRTIESILKQQHIHDIHVFDGGSTDETVDVLRGFGDALTFDSRPDGGQAEAVNKGMAAGSGAYIAWINSDDVYEPDAFAHVADIFASHPDVGVVYGEACHIDEYDAVIERYPTEDFNPSRLHETCFLSQPATFFRRELVERHGGLRADLRYCMDYELWLRFAQAGVQFRRTTAFLANTRFYADAKTLAARPQAHFEAADMFSQCLGERSGPWLSHFALIAAEHLEKQAGSSRDMAFDRLKRLASAFWSG